MTNPVSTSVTVSTSTTPAIGWSRERSNSEERVELISYSILEALFPEQGAFLGLHVSGNEPQQPQNFGLSEPMTEYRSSSETRGASVSSQVFNDYVPRGLAGSIEESRDRSTTRVVRGLKGIRPLPV